VPTIDFSSINGMSILRVSISPSNAEVNNVNTSFAAFRSQKDVSEFYISVHKIFGVYILDSMDLIRNASLDMSSPEIGNTNESNGKHQGGLDAKTISTFFTQGLEISAQ
jgi:hypothetical protein